MELNTSIHSPQSHPPTLNTEPVRLASLSPSASLPPTDRRFMPPSPSLRRRATPVSNTALPLPLPAIRVVLPSFSDELRRAPLPHPPIAAARAWFDGADARRAGRSGSLIKAAACVHLGGSAEGLSGAADNSFHMVGGRSFSWSATYSVFFLRTGSLLRQDVDGARKIRLEWRWWLSLARCGWCKGAPSCKRPSPVKC